MDRIKNIGKSLTDENTHIEITHKWETFNIRKFTSNTEKIGIAEIVSSSATSGGSINLLTAEIIYKLEIMRVYAGIGYDNENFVELYDISVLSGLFDKIIKTIPEPEINELNTMVSRKLREVELNYIRENNISDKLDKGLELVAELLNVLTDMYNSGDMENAIKSLSDELNKLDPDKLEYVNAFLEKVE